METNYVAPIEFMGTRPKIKDPIIVKDLFTSSFWDEIINVVAEFKPYDFGYDRGFGRFILKNEAGNYLLNKMLYESLPKAREIFESNTLLPTYGLFSRYQGYRSNLHRHKDTNACTYTLDVCISSKTNWPLIVEDKEYSLAPNEALCFYGEDQLHWRNVFPDRETNIVEMSFLHYAEPDHWFFTKGYDFYNEMLKDYGRPKN